MNTTVRTTIAKDRRKEHPWTRVLHRCRLAACVVSVIASALATAVANAANLQPAGLRCEYRINPVGLDAVQPRLSWSLASKQRGEIQTGYRILVSSSAEKLARDEGDLWDSGRVESDQQLHVTYAGKALVSRARCHWKVRVWDRNSHPSAWSEPAMWAMGLLDAVDWQAQWIASTDRVEAPRTQRLTGYHAREGQTMDEVRWVQVDLGSEQVLDEVKLYPPTPPGFEDVKGFGFPRRFRIEASNDPDFHEARSIADFMEVDYPNPGDEPRTFAAHSVRGRYVRVTAARLWDRRYGAEPFCFALGELEVLSGGRNVALKAAARALDSIEHSGWSLNHLTDGLKPLETPVLSSYRPERTKAEREGQGAETNDHPAYASVLLRKEVTFTKSPVRATAYVSGLGYHELYINGRKVGDHVLDPGFSDYSKRVFYVAHDVTGLLRAGRCTIGVMLGSGWYDSPATDVWGFHTAPWIAPPKLLLRIEVEYDDGTRTAIVSDASWKQSTGPIVFNSIRGGETYDARREKPGWDQPSYDDSAWSAAKVAPAPTGRLRAQSHPPIRVVESVRSVALTEPKPGVYVFDLGVNMAGWARLETRGAHGQKITLQFNELLNPDGTVNVEQNAGDTRGRFQRGEFILKGEGVEVYEPRFTYHGFRYVQVTGLAEKPILTSLMGRRVHTDPEPAGEFSCSSPLVNRIHEMIRRTQLSNLHGIPTDCPQREKIGWTADGCVTMEEAIYNFGMAAFYAKWVRDMLDAQDENGHASCIAPSPGWGKSNPDGSPPGLSDPWWGGAIVRAPWQIYRYYGDRRVLEESYDAMKRYLAYAAKYSPGHISWANEGDWLEVGAGSSSQRTPTQLAGTAVYFYHAKIVAEIARLLGRNEDAGSYKQLADEISASFHQRYFDAATGRYAKDSQTAQALPLYFGMTSADHRPFALEELFKNIRETRTNHISAGIIGTHYVFQTLMEASHDDLAYAMVTQQDFPSWGYMLRSGATTIWEAWTGAASRNHPALGSIGAWFYQGLGGIRLDPAAPAFKRFVIKPAVVGDLTWVRCSYQSLYGKIQCDWRREGDKLRLNVTIPANTTATVYVPTTQPGSVTESGQAMAKAAGVKSVRAEKEALVCQVGSGNYVFEAAVSSRAPSSP